MKLKELFETKERSVLSVMGKQADTYPGRFSCNSMFITSLEGAPKEVRGSFDCNYNELKSLEGTPHTVGGYFYAHDNELKSLKGIHKQIRYIGGMAIFRANPIESHVLGLLKIQGLIAVELDNLRVAEIINKHLKDDRDIFACQEELIEAGFPEFAQL